MNCMAKGQEERFSYSKLIYHLEQFLLEKVKKLEKDISSEIIVKKKANLARQYIAKVNAILQMEYFGKNKYDIPIYKFVEILKQDCQKLNQKRNELQMQIHNMEKNLETSIEFKLQSEYSIPDEAEIQKQAINVKRHQYMLEIETVRDELKVYQYRWELCRNLQGIIARPNGFFSSVYKL